MERLGTFGDYMFYDNVFEKSIGLSYNMEKNLWTFARIYFRAQILKSNFCIFDIMHAFSHDVVMECTLG